MLDLLGLISYGYFPVPRGIFPYHYLGRSGTTLRYPPGSDFNTRMRLTPFSASFEFAALSSVLSSIDFSIKRHGGSCCIPGSYTRSATDTGYVLPSHDPDLFVAINRYTIKYDAAWTIRKNCCVSYVIIFRAYDIYDFSTFASVALGGVPLVGKPFRIEWYWLYRKDPSTCK